MTDPIFLKVTVEISDNHSELLYVRKSDLTRKDGISRLAENFCYDHGLDVGRVRGPLEAHIRENISQAEAKQKYGKKSSTQQQSAVLSARGQPSARGLRDDGQLSASHVPQQREDENDVGAGANGYGYNGGYNSSSPSYSPKYGQQKTGSAREALQNHILSKIKGAQTYIPTTRTRGVTRDVFHRLHNDASQKQKRFEGKRNEIDENRRSMASPIKHNLRNHGLIHDFDPPGRFKHGQDQFQSEGAGAGGLLGEWKGNAASSGLGDGANGNLKQNTASAGTLGSSRGKFVNISNPNHPDYIGPTPASAASQCEKLYRDAQEKQQRLLEKQKRQKDLQRYEQEMHSFKPDIVESQKKVAGIHDRTTDRHFAGGGYEVGRVLDSMKSRKTALRLENLRREKADQEMKECSFQPRIDSKSAAMMQRRIGRLKITGSLHDHLYEDARRREERMIEYSSLVSPEVTFRPNIGNDKFRPSIDANVDEFFHRLSTQKSTHSKSVPQTDPIDRLPFRPTTGRGPNFPRNEDGKPVGLFLYEVGKYVKSLKNEIVEAKHQEDAAKREKKMGNVSRSVYLEVKKKRYRDIFAALSDPSNGIATKETFNLDNVDEQFREFLQPVKAYLEETGGSFDFEGFTVTMDYVLERTGVPSSQLFAQGSIRQTRTMQKSQEVVKEKTFTPRLNRNSVKMTANRNSSVPIHQRLWNEKDKWESKKQKRQSEKILKDLSECTFAPNKTPGDNQSRSIIRQSSIKRGNSRNANNVETGAHTEQIEHALMKSQETVQSAEQTIARIQKTMA